MRCPSVRREFCSQATAAREGFKFCIHILNPGTFLGMIVSLEKWSMVMLRRRYRKFGGGIVLEVGLSKAKEVGVLTT